MFLLWTSIGTFDGNKTSWIALYDVSLKYLICQNDDDERTLFALLKLGKNHNPPFVVPIVV